MTEEATRLTFSMVIPSRNEADWVERCIRSVLANEYPADKMEIIVADGMSQDGTRQIIERLAKEDPRIRLFDNPLCIMPCGANIGIRHSTGDVVTVLSGHTLVSPNYMAECNRILVERPDVWRAGGVMETVAASYIGKVVAAAQSSPAGVGAGNWRLGVQEGYVPLVPFGATRRWVFDKIGLYDEELVRNQDDELTQRLVEAGGKQYMTQSVRVQYFCRGSIWKLARQYYQYGFWRLRTIQKRKRPAHLRQILPILFVAAWFPLALLAVAGAIWWWPLVLPLAACAAGYVLGLIGNILWVAKRDGLKVALLTPPACATIHFSYGVGALKGFWSWVILKGRFVPKPEAHSMSR
jgi:glycosyltransferase involved in cell wall biosynthesis